MSDDCYSRIRGAASLADRAALYFVARNVGGDAGIHCVCLIFPRTCWEGVGKKIHLPRKTLVISQFISFPCGEWCGEELRGYDLVYRNPLNFLVQYRT